MSIKPIGLILARGGSKGIPGKNLKPVNGIPLLARTIRAARDGGLSFIYVYSDSAEIRSMAEAEGAIAIKRPEEVSGDTISSEDTVKQFLADSGVDKKADVMLLQCTTPFLKGKHIEKALEIFFTKKKDGEYDSVISCCSVDRYLGYRKGVFNNGGWVPFYPYRWLRQEHERSAFFMENGGIYLAKRHLWNQGRRIGELCGIVRMHWYESIEIDDPDDLYVAESIAPMMDKFDWEPPEEKIYLFPNQNKGEKNEPVPNNS